jgi:MFS transporter, putative metabolite:H+ symporter
MVNAGARLDRLPISRFHYGLLGLIAAGMFLDAFEIYLQGGVLATLVGTGWSTPAMNANFVSSTFAGMVGGAWLAGICGDRYGRRFAYQINLLVFGLASLAGAAAPSMTWLIIARFFMGLGLGAEIVVGYVTISEFVPPLSRGRWGTMLAVITNSALFVSALVARVVIPNFGWRWMFILVGAGAMFVWFLRRNMPESPRWLEANGRDAEAEAVISAIERRVAPAGGLPDPAIAVTAVKAHTSILTLFAPGMLMRTVLGSVVLIALNTAVYGFIAFLPTFMVRQGMSVVTSLNYTTLMMFGGPVGALIGLWTADRLGRKNCIVWFSLLAIVFGALYPQMHDPALVTLTGFLLITAVYVLVAIGWSLYVPELFPTEIRMRGAGFCNTAGRMMTIITPQIIVPLFINTGVDGVIALVAGLLLLQAVLVGLFGIESREKTLEELNPWQEGSAAFPAAQEVARSTH